MSSKKPQIEDVLKNYGTDPFMAAKKSEAFVKRAPLDYIARANYIILLTKICAFDQAKAEYDKLEARIQRNNYTNSRKRRILRVKMVVAKTKILSAFGEYQELYDLFNANRGIFSEEDCSFFDYYCSIRLGLFEGKATRSSAYRFEQIKSYSEEAFREHLKRHLQDEEIFEKFKTISAFAKGFPIDQVIAEVKKYIPSDNRIYPGYYYDTYFFKYSSCGYSRNGNLTDFFRVDCFHDTTDIITMYPAEDCEKMPFVDLNYLNPQKTLRHSSQVDKFYQRYGKRSNDPK